MAPIPESLANLRREPFGPSLSSIASMPNALAIRLLARWARFARICGMLVRPTAAVCRSITWSLPLMTLFHRRWATREVVLLSGFPGKLRFRSLPSTMYLL